MANGEVGIKIKVSAKNAVNNLNKLKTLSTKLQTSFKKVEIAAKRLQNRAGTSFQKFGNRVRKVRRKVQVDIEKMKRSFKGMNNIGALIGGAGLGLFAKASVETAANAQALELRLKLLTQEFGEYEQAQKIASRAARTFGMSNIEATEGVTNIIGRLRPLGLSLKEIETTFFGFNTAAKLAGVSTIEASNAFRQLAQALGSGRLAGDEFRSISEQVPTILKPIADELNTTVGKLKELGAEGKLTSDIVIRALQKIQSEGSGKIASIISQSDLQVFKDFNNALEDLRNTVGKALNPVIIPLTKNITNLINAFNDANPIFQKAVILIGGVAATALIAVPVIAGLAVALKGIAAVFTTGAGKALLAIFSIKALPVIALVGGLAAAITGLGIAIGNQNKAQREFDNLLNTDSQQAINKQIELLEKKIQRENSSASSALGLGVAEAINTQKYKDQIIQLKERLKFLELTRREQLKLQGFTDKDIDDIFNEEALNKFLNRNKSGSESGDTKATPLFDSLKKEQRFLKDALTMGTARAKLEQRIRDLKAEENGLTDEQARKQILLLDADQKRLALQEQIKNVLADGMTNAVLGLIEGTKTLSESLAGIARQLASMFLNKAFGSIFGGIFQAEGGYNRAGSFKAFQYGGVVSSPTLGMIGEGGEPEYVIPSSKMDGAMARYSAGARGGAVIPGGSGASGTVAGSSGNTIVEYTGPVLNFNGDEYVPKDSVPQIINAAAKQGATLGQSRTLNTLKNSRSSRAKIGI